MKKFYVFGIFFLTLTAILAGCSTGSTAAKRDYATYSQGGVTIDLYYMNSKELYNVYGNRNNPFARHLTGPAITIEVLAKTDQQAHIITGQATLQSEAGTLNPVEKEWMLNYWHQTLMPKGPKKNTSIVFQGWSEKVVLEQIESEVLPGEVDLNPGTETRGLILFDTLRNVKTPVTFKLPVYDRSGNLIQTVEYEFTL